MDDEILSDLMEEKENPNEIIEIDKNEEINNTQYDIEVKKELQTSNKKMKKPSKWSNLSKKQKIIIIVCISLVLLIIIGLLLYFLIFKKDKNNNNPDEPMVIVEKDNYRYEDGNLIFIDEDKKELGKYECSNKKEENCYVAYYSDDDFDIDKKVYEDGSLILNRSDIMHDNYVFIYDSNKKDAELILYNIKDKKEESKYDLVKELDKDKVIVASNDKYSIIEFGKSDYEEVDNFRYDYIGYIEESKYLIVATNKNYKLVDFEGEDVSKTVPGEIKNYSDKNISVKANGNYYVYDYSGKSIVDEKFDYIRFVSDYIIAASNMKLSIYDSEGAKMNGEDIKISSSEYNSKLIFNDELRQTGKEVAFDAYLNGETLKLEFDEETVNVNLNEGAYNKTLSYISYFAGKLYIYNDEAKTRLLGTYPCEYANAVGSDTKTLDNCFLANESNLFSSDDVKNGYLPIYNERYVFIADTKSPNANDNIILWDLKQNKKLATYKEVDAGFHETDDLIKHVKTAGNLVVAKNTSDSYGLINITDSSINGVIPFKDASGNTNTSVKVLDNNLVFKRSDGTYHLYTKKGVELASNLNTKNEIVEYKNPYIKVKSTDDIYMIYSTDGKVISNEAKYIIMESSYYILVDKNNNLEVYKYDDKVNLAPEGLKVDGKNYSKEINYGLRGSILVLTYILNNETNVVEVNIG